MLRSFPVTLLPDAPQTGAEGLDVGAFTNQAFERLWVDAGLAEGSQSSGQVPYPSLYTTTQPMFCVMHYGALKLLVETMI
jgi:hypothetical protein